MDFKGDFVPAERSREVESSDYGNSGVVRGVEDKRGRGVLAYIFFAADEISDRLFFFIWNGL